jgi:hypothetical protein
MRSDPTARELHRAYTREIVRRQHAAIMQAIGQWLRLPDIDAFYAGAECHGGQRWTCRGQRRAVYHRLESAGLLEHGCGMSMFGMAWSEASVTERGRHAMWLLALAHHETMPMLRLAIRKQREERLAGVPDAP